MTSAVVLAEPVEEPLAFDARLTDAALALRQRRDEDIPWWAIELLDLRQHDPLYRVRRMLRHTRPRFPRMWNLYAELVAKAESTVMQRPIEAWRTLCYNNTDPVTWEAKPIAAIIRDAALFNPRSFCALVDLRDEEGYPIVLKDFHMQMLAAMRQTSRPAMIQCFWGGGKSWLSNTIVPLMDWAEWPAATEGRIYLDEDLVKKWTGRLMQIVESNDALHQIFPWISKPRGPAYGRKADPGHKIWSYDGFAIAGNPIQQRSFEGHTIGSSKTGFRFNRTGIDDVVSVKECSTASIQDRNLEYIKGVALTTRQITQRPRSKYGTVFPGIFTSGTPYDRVDVNVRLEQEYRERGYKVVRIPIFVGHKQSERPRWPERHTAFTLAAMREEMGARAFNMRCRLQVGGRTTSLFPESAVDFAIKDGRSDPNRFDWCVVPQQTKLIIGFDPASGNKPQHHGAKYPAYVVYGLRDLSAGQRYNTAQLLRDYGDPQPVAPVQADLYHHVIQWSRLEGVGFHSQCKLLVDLAHVYNCPIAFEDNGQQIAYAEEIARLATDVKTICHTTGLNKRDPQQGVDQFEPILLNQRLVIHAEGAPPDTVKALRDELVGWPTWNFSDLVMALWIGRHQFALHIQQSAPVAVTRRQMPAYVKRFTRQWH